VKPQLSYISSHSKNLGGRAILTSDERLAHNARQSIHANPSGSIYQIFRDQNKC